jgi:hypothetical protein
MAVAPTMAADPWTALGGSFLAGFGASLNSPAGPSNAVARQDSPFDSSGWNVNFGAGSISSADSRDQGQMGQLSPYLPYIIAGAAVLIVWRMTRKS